MLGFLVPWPKIFTLMMLPIPVRVYRKLARREERDTLAGFGEKYSSYMVNAYSNQ
jgi:methanethiol S-methyltransferase